MLVLFETPAGYAVFKVLDEKKLQEVDSLWREFETPEKANKIVKLKHFEKFQDTTEALAACTALVEGKLSKNLKKILKKIVAKDAHEQLAIADAKLGGVIKDKLNLSCIHSPMVTELMRGIRSQIEGLITGLPSREMAAMCLGLAHSLSRYKLKFSPDKVDTMIVQAISLLDDLDKELNNYIMRCREWYGWHFPELGKIVADNLTYCKCVRKVGDRRNFSTSDLSEVLPEEIDEDVKAAAEISMGTEVSEEDINNILHLCDQVIEISEYRTQLYDYLKNRMMAIAPNLTVMVGELVGARLIAHAGSLLNLAKHPASTVQILGAEKALFRALKTKRDTPKFGLIYHASLVGQTSTKNKGKISRMLAAKTALTIRYDALGEDSSAEMGAENRLKVETRLRHLEEKGIRRISGTGKALARADKYQHKSEVKVYDPSGDSTLPAVPKKRKIEEVEEEEMEVTVKGKKIKVEIKEEADVEEGEPVKKKKKKKEKKQRAEEEAASAEEPSTSTAVESTEKKKKKKKIKVEQED
ncbi:nucleolar protein 58 [Terrapene carolina triunguis]|uniref:Nucleolar protein 58 n=1 Tax=Terrapene triunguis TaxID=2587831 RepID=A0A674IZP6_9SAUR|nr:nucleolar protein 58 [Terrapene carolina triunguis]